MVERGVLFFKLTEVIEQFDDVVGICAAFQIFVERQERFGHLRLGDDVNLAPTRDHHGGSRKYRDVTCLASGRLTEPYGDYLELAMIGREKLQQAISEHLAPALPNH